MEFDANYAIWKTTGDEQTPGEAKLKVGEGEGVGKIN